MRRLLRACVRLLPPGFRGHFGAELADTVAVAARAAHRRGGNRAMVQYLTRELLSFAALLVAVHRASARDDLRSAIRRSLRQPLPAAALVITLALCIAAVTTAFGVATAVLWRPLPFDDPDRLVFVWEQSRETREPFRVVSGRLGQWEQQRDVFSSVALFGFGTLTFETPDGATPIRGLRTSANYFATLGWQPLLGRGFAEGEDAPGRNQVIVLSYELWRERFGARADIVGAEVRLDGRPFTVIGVMPLTLSPGPPVNPATVVIDPDSRQFWIPIERTPAFLQNTRAHVFGIVARLRPGVSLDHARMAIDADASAAISDAHGATVVAFREQFVSSARVPLLLLLTAALAVLLTACANVAAVHIASYERRRVELVMRSALGAGAPRLARQLAFEVMVTSLLAGIIATGLSAMALQAVPALLPANVPLLTVPELDWRVAAIGIGAGLVTGLLLAAWPVLFVLSGNLASRGVAAGPRHPVYRVLVASQVATAVVMVAAASLLVQSMQTLARRDPGFVVDRVLVTDIGAPPSFQRSPEAIVQFERALLSKLAGVDGVRQVATAYDHPLESNWSNNFTLVGSVGTLEDETTGQSELRIVSPGYFAALGVQFLQGRPFTEDEDYTRRGVAVVNDAFVHRVSGAAVGRVVRSSPPRFSWGQQFPEDFEIVGVVEDERFRGLDAPALPALYLSTRQFPQPAFALLVATAPGATAVHSAVRHAIRDTHSLATSTPPRRLADILASQMATRQMTTAIVRGLAGVALVLAAIGIYGLLALTVSARGKEFGVRLAIGATPMQVAAQIVRESLGLALIGVVIGAGVSIGTARLLEGLLVDVRPGDPMTRVGVAAVLLVTTLAATLLPAVRAARVDPVATLKGE